jgi:hypothetical protein
VWRVLCAISERGALCLHSGIDDSSGSGSRNSNSNSVDSGAYEGAFSHNKFQIMQFLSLFFFSFLLSFFLSLFIFFF